MSVCVLLTFYFLGLASDAVQQKVVKDKTIPCYSPRHYPTNSGRFSDRFVVSNPTLGIKVKQVN